MSTRLVNKNYFPTIQSTLGTFLEKKPTDCILYSEDGSRFKIHKVSKDLHYLLTLGMEEDKLTRNFWICRKTKSGDRVSLSYDLTTF